jgi:hypothetical protein
VNVNDHAHGDRWPLLLGGIWLSVIVILGIGLPLSSVAGRSRLVDRARWHGRRKIGKMKVCKDAARRQGNRGAMAMWKRFGLHRLLLVAATSFAAAPAAAITVTINYDYDTTGFFPPGSQATAAIEAAASFYSNILNDTFSAIQTPTTLIGANGGTVVWEWREIFGHPASGATLELSNPTVAENEFVVYVGARNLGGSIGQGGPGGFGWSWTQNGPALTPQEVAQRDATTAAFTNAVEKRGETSGFARWGGAVSFDNSGSTLWHFNHTTLPPANRTDFYSVALHELGHTLGFGELDNDAMKLTAWEAQLSGTSFIGADAKAQNGNVAVPLSSNKSHWVAGKTSLTYGGSVAQEAALDPDLTIGTRKLFTALDAAAFKDLAWELVSGDYNSNGRADAADYVVWRNMSGQLISPGGAVADGSGNGHIGSEDYTFWRNRFNATFAGASAFGGGASLTVPEPKSTFLIAISVMRVVFAHFRRRR